MASIDRLMTVLITPLLIPFGLSVALGDETGPLPLQLELTRSVSKLPFVIALDQDLYDKYGLDVDVRLEDPEFEGAIEMPVKPSDAGSWRPPIRISGNNRRIYEMATDASEPFRVTLAATDCVVRQQVIARQGIERLEDLEGKRIGVSSIGSNSGFVVLLLAERMVWDPVQDISIMWNGNTLDVLRSGRVDAFIADERSFAVAEAEGLPVFPVALSDDEPIPGNSVMVQPDWLADPANREVAVRFLKAMLEGIAIFHRDRELVIDILERWHGMERPIAEAVYESGQDIPKKPYPCYDGIAAAIERYDSNEMRRYETADFVEDSLLRELDESGFIDALYAGRSDGDEP